MRQSVVTLWWSQAHAFIEVIVVFGAVIRRRAERTGFRFPAGAIEFPLFHNAEIGSDANSSFCLVAAGGRRPGFGANHSPPFNIEVKNEWRYTFAPLVLAFMARTGTTLPLQL
jgi:hypothetical protein